MEICGKKVVITGGARGMGRQFAVDLKAIDEITAQIPLGCFGEMSEISKAVRFIIDCDFVNGRVIEVDGGHRI